MQTYRGAEQLWKAFGEGKKITANPNHYCMHYEMKGFDSKYDVNVYVLRYDKPLYYYMNPQMNRLLAFLENGKTIDTHLDMWDLNVTTWFDYDEIQELEEECKVVEMSIEDIQKKLGYKIKIVE